MKDFDLIIANLRSAKKRTAAQDALLSIVSKGEDGRSKEDVRNLAVLLKSERAAIAAKEAEAKAGVVLKKQRSEAERARTHRLIQLGALIDLAGLGEKSRGELLGLLLSVERLVTDPSKWEQYKQFGDAKLAEISNSKKTSAVAAGT